MKNRPNSESNSDKSEKGRPKHKPKKMIEYIRHYELILCFLFNKRNNKIYKNKIYDHLRNNNEDNKNQNTDRSVKKVIKTGLRYKQYTLDALDYLEKEDIITKEKWRGKHFFKLTDIGHDLANMMVFINVYVKSYNDLSKVVNDLIVMPEDIDEKSERAILRNRNLTNDEIAEWDRYVSDMDIRTLMLEHNFLQIIMIRIVMIYHKYEVKELGKLLIDFILSKSTKFHIEFTLNRAKFFEQLLKRDDEFIYEMNTHNQINDCMEMLYNLKYPKIISNQVKNSVSSFLHLLDPSKQIIENMFSKHVLYSPITHTTKKANKSITEYREKYYLENKWIQEIKDEYLSK